MAVMGLTINGNGGGSGLSGGISALAKALYGDPEREMKMAKLRSDLATDEYQRRQLEQYTRLLEAKDAHQRWQTQSGQGGVAPAAKFFEDTVNAGRGAGIMPSPDAPVAVDVGPVAPAGPAYNTTMGPETFVSAFPARPAAISDNRMPVPVADDDIYAPPQMISTFPARPNALSDNMPAVVEPDPLVVDADVSDFLGRPDVTTSPEGIGPFPGRPGIPASNRTPDATVLSSILRDLRQRDMDEGLRPAYDEPPAPVMDLSPSPDPETPADLSPYHQTTVPTPVAPTGLRSIDSLSNTLLPTNPPDASRLFEPVPLEPLAVEGRPYQGPPVPPPPDASIAPEMPVPVEPIMAQRQFQGPNLPVTPDGTITDPAHPKAPVVAVDTPQGPLPMTSDEYQAYAAMLIANGGDVAGALNKAAGGLAMTYGSLDNPARMRIAAQLMSGNMADRDTVVTAGDDAGTKEAIKIAQATEAAKPTDYTKNIIDGQEIFINPVTKRPEARAVSGFTKDPSKKYVTGPGGHLFLPQADGSLVLAPGQGDESGHIQGNDATSNAYNTLIDLNAQLDAGTPLNASQQRAYEGSWKILNDPVTTISRDSEGKPQVATNMKPPPGTVFRDPSKAGVQGAASPAAAAAAPTQAEQITADRPVEPGQPITTVNLKTGKAETVTNKWGGWTMPGEQPPAETHEVPTPGGGKAVISTYGDKKVGQMTESTTKNYRFFNEALPAAYDLDKILPGQEPSSFQRALEMFRQQGIKEEWLTGNYLDPETRSYARAMYTFINGFARPDSGATILPEEFKKYESRFVMPANAKLRDYVEVKANRAAALRAMRMTFNGQVPSEQLSDTDTQILRYGQDLDYRPETDPGYQRVLAAQKAREGGGGTAPAAAPAESGTVEMNPATGRLE